MNASNISRRDLLSSALMLLGSSAFRMPGFAGQDAGVRPAGPAPAPTKARWTAEAVRMLRIRQELEYARLGKRIGIAGDAMTVYRTLTKDQMPAERISPEKFWETFGSTLPRDEARGVPEAQIAEYLARYGKVQPPTPFEDPTLYAVLIELSDSIESRLKSLKLPIPPGLLLGTLPTGTVNALTMTVPRTRERIVIFERGLFDFAFQMSKIAASVFPPIDPRRGWFSADVDIDRAVQGRPDLLDQVHRILHAYLVQGDSRRVPAYPLDQSQLMTAALLLRSLELFVLGHEYGHVITSHTDDTLGPVPSNDPTIRADWNTEYGSDQVGVSLMVAVMGDLSLTFWGAVQFFVGLEVFHRCRSILANGSVTPHAGSPTHPPHLARGQQLRVVLREGRPGAETEKAIALANQLDSFWSRVWQVAEPHWLAQYQQGVRLSPIWS